MAIHYVAEHGCREIGDNSYHDGKNLFDYYANEWSMTRFGITYHKSFIRAFDLGEGEPSEHGRETRMYEGIVDGLAAREAFLQETQ